MGVSNFAGIPGTDNTDVYDICEKYGIRPIVVRNEMFAPMFADGYSRVSRKLGVVLTIPGPGALATLPGLLEAHAGSIPQLVIATDVASAYLFRKGHLHQVDDLKSAFQPVTDGRFSVENARALTRVMHHYQSSVPKGDRTALFVIPADVYQQEGGAFAPTVVKEKLPLPDLSEAIRLLCHARRPVIFAGAGVWWANAIEPLRELAHKLKAPVFTSVKGKGVISDSEECSFGQLSGEPELRECLAKSDLAILVGTRWSQRSTDTWSLRLPDTVVEINIRQDHWRPTEERAGTLVRGDAKDTLSVLVTVVPQSKEDSWLAECTEARGRALERMNTDAPVEMELMRALRKAIPDDAIVVNDSTVATYWTRRYFPVYTAGTFLWPMGSGTIGWALPAALGAKLAVQESGQDRPVIALIGDGGFQFSMQELGTMVQENLPVVIVLFDSASYSVIQHFQKKRYGKITGATVLKNPYFGEIAHAYNLTEYCASTPTEIGSAISRALGSGSPTLIHCPIRLNPPERL